MQLKSYRAWTMNDALAAVKRDLGADAVILHTRTFKRGGFLHIGRKTVIEVTAARAADMQTSRAAEPGRQPGAMPMAARRAYATAPSGSPAQPRADAQRAEAQSPSRAAHVPFERQRTRLLAQAMVVTQDRQGGSEPASVPSPGVPGKPAQVSDCKSPDSLRSPAPIQANATARPNGDAAPCSAEAVARRFILTPAAGAVMSGATGSPTGGAAVRGNNPTDTRPYTVAPGAHNESSQALNGCGSRRRDRFNDHDIPNAASVQEELSAIKGLVGRVLQSQAGYVAQAQLPGALFDMYLRLISQDVSAELADRVVASVRDRLGVETLDDIDAVRVAMCDELARLIPSSGDQSPPSRQGDRPFVLALIGPTGVGKTTTVAKLAAAFKLRHQRRVGLITCDTYRIAAVDQLRTYAEIIGVPLEVATTPADMGRSMKSLQGNDIVLIDTAGRGQNDIRRLDELGQFIAAASPDEVHLVLSSTAGEKVLLREAEAFSSIRADQIVLTKLDEAVSMGMVINVMHRVGKSLSFITTGQEVPDHIEPGRTQRLAALLLGESMPAVPA